MRNISFRTFQRSDTITKILNVFIFWVFFYKHAMITFNADRIRGKDASESESRFEFDGIKVLLCEDSNHLLS